MSESGGVSFAEWLAGCAATDDLWAQFSPLPHSAMATHIEAFIDFLRTQGFVELEGTIAIGLSYS